MSFPAFPATWKVPDWLGTLVVLRIAFAGAKQSAVRTPARPGEVCDTGGRQTRFGSGGAALSEGRVARLPSATASPRATATQSATLCSMWFQWFRKGINGLTDDEA